MKTRLAWAALLSVRATASVDAAPPATRAKVRVVLAGDSTVTDDAGWGSAFARRLAGDVECVNLARGGRSSGSFVAEGSWRKCLDLEPDYVLIQFGHNDQPGHGPIARRTRRPLPGEHDALRRGGARRGHHAGARHVARAAGSSARMAGSTRASPPMSRS